MSLRAIHDFRANEVGRVFASFGADMRQQFFGDGDKTVAMPFADGQNNGTGRRTKFGIRAVKFKTCRPAAA